MSLYIGRDFGRPDIRVGNPFYHTHTLPPKPFPNIHLQEVFHVYWNSFENAVIHLILVMLGNN